MEAGANGPDKKPNGYFAHFGDALRRHVWLRWVLGIGVVVIVVAIATSPEEKSTESVSTVNPPAESAPGESADDGQTARSASSTSTDSTPKPAPEPKKPSQKEQVKDALAAIDWTAQDPEIKDVEFGRRELTVTVATPEGGFEGASTRDLNEQAAAVFQAIYGDAGYAKTGSVVVFKGGLVDSKTGKDLPDVNTGIYSISKRDAGDIDWSDDDAVRYTIEWPLYRDFAHPALKQDD